MRDPHVESMRYRFVVIDETTTFSEAAPAVELTTDEFSARLDDGLLEIKMSVHYASEADARAAVEPYLHAWEVLHALRVSRTPEFRFEFVTAEVIDRSPPPPGARHIIALAGRVEIHSNVSATLTVNRGAYPVPPTSFFLDADALTLWQRWQGYVAGREPLQAMAYFCLTVLELHGGRAGAAARYAIARGVLETVGRLSSETGDASTARKATTTLRPLSPTETTWLEATVRALVRRAGEVAADAASERPTLSMKDLPPL
jgi:hypothetical protein